MKYFKFSIVFALVLMAFTRVPAFAYNPFADIISGTKIYFSHIAIKSGWETEIAVLNPTAKEITGNFKLYDMSGKQLGGTIQLILKPHGRYQADVGAEFSQYENIEYILFTATTYGLKGYSKFYHNVNGARASIVASAPQTTGLFTKIDHEGWTGIVFINTSSAVAQITLIAYGDDGKVKASIVKNVTPGAKVVMTDEAIFAPQPINDASYIRFTSNQSVVAFFLNGSADNSKLDGSKAQ